MVQYDVLSPANVNTSNKVHAITAINAMPYHYTECMRHRKMNGKNTAFSFTSSYDTNAELAIMIARVTW